MMALLLLAAVALPPAEPIDRAAWITAEDYPAEALAMRAQGTVGFQLDLDTEGAVATCTITRSSGYAILDIATCKLLRERAHYRIQRDEHSKPLPFVVRSATTWRLPTADQGRDRNVKIIEGPAGTRCIADYDGKDRPLPAPTCAQITAAVRARSDPPGGTVTVWLPDALPAGR